MTLDARIGSRLFRGKRAAAATEAQQSEVAREQRPIGRTRILWAWLRRRRPSTSLTRRILAINLLGDWLRDALNPKLR